MSRKQPIDVKNEMKRELAQKTLDVYSMNGGQNDSKARYIAGVAQAVLMSDKPIFTPLKPRIVDHDEEQWVKSMCFCIAFLRKNNMSLTIQTIKAECQKLPKSTGFSRASMLDNYWKKLKKCALHLGDKTFDEWVIEYKEAEDKLMKETEKPKKLAPPVLND